MAEINEISAQISTNPNDQRSLVSIIADNKKGMLAKFAQFFAENDMNIEQLTLAAADMANKIHRTTAYITGDRARIDGLCKKMEGIEGVHKIVNFVAEGGLYLERELGLIKIKTTNPALGQVMSLISEYDGKTVFVGKKTSQQIMIFVIEDEGDKIENFIEKVAGVTDDIEILRTGIVATTLDENLERIR